MRRRPTVRTYFVRCASGYVKIGRSCNPEARLRELQAANPEPLVLLHVIEGDQERRLHRQFAAHRVTGEWFRPTPEMERLMGATVAPEPLPEPPPPRATFAPEPTPEVGRLLPAAEVAAALGTTVAQLARLRESRAGPTYIRFGASGRERVVYRVSDINAWLRAGGRLPSE